MLHINDDGFSNRVGPIPLQEEVEACKRWIIKFCKKRKSFNRDRHSYELKHKVERWANYYVSNGAFIKAACELGYKYKKVGNSVTV